MEREPSRHEVALRPEDALWDDDDFIVDTILKKLHQNEDGHLASKSTSHSTSVLKHHNIATIYFYVFEGEVHTIFTRHICSREPLSYQQWFELVDKVVIETRKQNNKRIRFEPHGWHTSFKRVHFLREGDIVVKIEFKGVFGVRFTFDTRAHINQTFSRETTKIRLQRSSRIRQ